MLLRLLRTHLRPYRGWLAIVVVLQFVGVVAMLYLPSLNADIIDNGVARGELLLQRGDLVRAQAADATRGLVVADGSLDAITKAHDEGELAEEFKKKGLQIVQVDRKSFIAAESTPVFFTKSSTCSGCV
mgnify:CR=1 FL=1